MSRAARRRAPLLTAGQLSTAVISLVVGAVLVLTTLPAVLDSRDAAGRVTQPGAPGSTTTTSVSEPPTTDGPLTASDQGVTADAVKVGVVLLDLSAVEPLGLGLENYEIELQKAAFDAYFELVNDAGGINGRRIEPVYASSDVLATTGPHSDQAICLRMAKDEEVFAVIGYPEQAVSCLTARFGIPTVGGSGVEQQFEDAHHLLVTAAPAIERIGRNWARALVETGIVVDHRVGLLSVGDSADASLGAGAAEAMLDELGHPLALHEELSPTNGIAGVQVAVQNMKEAGVDQVMFATSFAEAVQFITFAEDQKYYPTYLTSGIGALAADGLLRSAPKSLDGAIGFNVGAYPAEGELETPDVGTCRQQFNDGTDGPGIPDLEAGEENSVTTICGIVDLFVQAATAAGSDLTSASFVGAVQGLEDFHFPGMLSGSFGPGKTDYADGLQPLRYSDACHCYEPAGDPIYLDDVS